MKLFSGTAHPYLTRAIAQKLPTEIADCEVVRFHNSEVRVRINESVHHENCIVVQPTANPTDTHLMELVFFCDALRRAESHRVIGVLPYFGYARQNIQHRAGECVSVNVIIRLLESIGFSKIYTIDLHDEATEGVFTIPFKRLSAFPMLASAVHTYMRTTESVMVVSPDQGGIERARQFANALFGKHPFSLGVIEKKRDQNHIHESKALDLYGNVTGKTVILVDDIVTSGKTLLNAADLCLERGAKKVIAAVVHHDFSPEAPQLIQSSSITRFFTTDTIALPKEHRFEKLHEISVASLIADELRPAS